MTGSHLSSKWPLLYSWVLQLSLPTPSTQCKISKSIAPARPSYSVQRQCLRLSCLFQQPGCVSPQTQLGVCIDGYGNTGLWTARYLQEEERGNCELPSKQLWQVNFNKTAQSISPFWFLMSSLTGVTIVNCQTLSKNTIRNIRAMWEAVVCVFTSGKQMALLFRVLPSEGWPGAGFSIAILF